MTKNVAIYTRVSSKKQELNGVSLEAQLQICQEYANRQGWNIVAEYQEVKSGRSDERRIFRMVCQEAIAGEYEIILCHKSDRFARNRILAATQKRLLRQHGVDVVTVVGSVDLDPDDPLRFLLDGIQELFDEWYVINLATETLKGQLQRIRQGYWPGASVALGYQSNQGKLIPHDPYSEKIGSAFKEFSTGKHTLHSWAKQAKALGIARPNGNIITPTGWHYIFKNPVYKGVLSWAGLEVAGTHEAVTTVEIYDRVQNILDQHRAGSKKRKPRQSYLLSGRLWSLDANCRMKCDTRKGIQYYFSVEKCPNTKKAHYVQARKINIEFGNVLHKIRVEKHTLDTELPDLDPILMMGLKTANTLGDAWAWFSDKQKKELLNLIVKGRGVNVAGGHIDHIDLRPPFFFEDKSSTKDKYPR